MNLMFLASDEHSRFLFDCVADKPATVQIASFGIYAGITFTGSDTTQWGPRYRLATRDLLESLRTCPQVQLLIGVAEYRSCKDKLHCVDCEKSYVKQLLRLVNHAEVFPEFEWRVTTELHMKCALFFYPESQSPRGVAGGRNFTDSTWADVTFELFPQQIHQLGTYFGTLWGDSQVVSDAAVADIFEQQQISTRGFQSVLALVDGDTA